MEIAHSLQQTRSSYIREILSAATDKNVISLAGGLPDEQTFPIALMQPMLEKLAHMPEIFQYGATAGYQPLINYLHELYQLPDTHTAMICTGSQQGLDLIARAYFNPQDTIAMEAPSYLGAMQVFNLVQANIVTVPQTEDGPDIALLEQCFQQQQPKAFYAVPDFHNPTGVCWSLSVRQQVAALCCQYNVVLIEDAPYRELRFSGEALPLVSDFCPNHSIVLRSFSKIASPGLRIGVVTGKRGDLEPLIKVKQGADLHSSVPMQALLLGLLQHPDFEQHIQRIRHLYQSRYDCLYTALSQQLPQGCHLKPINGGMFIWLSLPDCDTFALAKTMLTKGVAVVPSPVFYPDAAPSPAALRLNFTNASPEELTEAVNRLADGLKAYLN
ncbi:2-aminoadipate transaminase [Vibrio ruber DSM 16370]|uniref:2-aminoadipate transaminase n=1 Tax=Vibrio ruber (strain DSM 16370 / JCM 11486 / BCRC 17186 / CECT 7878 / LMG 23124 / VR1) TaxID=1123498 RepID=A0A1R4LS95_VIBR1|nr:PLP-dependent aminotransferase family protein [Vibrio ruber]SJN59187.1 2-aminoadipate transaminase [Vibrio ruber DSM 16370]